MLKNKKSFWLGAILAGLIVSACALAPQIDLWMSCENNCNGIYAITDIDEPFYAAYLQSLMDGKPRRNSPYSGAVDSPETPQIESYLAIQFLASYPLALIGKVFGLSISQLMIFTSWLAGFLAAFAVYWLIYQFTEDNICAFVGTMIVLFLGATIGGQGAISALFSTDKVHFQQSLIFLRRSVPAIGFPSLFLFILFVWKFFNAETHSDKLRALFFAICSFAFAVYSYFYFWTTLFAWFFGLVGLFAIFNFAKLKENIRYLCGFGISLIAVLTPYFILILNRQTNTDSALFMNLTREPDLWRLPEIVSYSVTALVLIFAIFRLIDLKNNLTIFLLSLNLVSIVVFNQQIITGRSIQAFHYEFFCVNYLMTISPFLMIFIMLKNVLSFDRLKLAILLLIIFPLCVGSLDMLTGTPIFRSINIFRDSLVPVATKIRELSRTPDFQADNQKGVVLSFDIKAGNAKLVEATTTDLPALTSQPILWGLHLHLMPDIRSNEDKKRLKQFLYYQNFSKNQLKEILGSKSSLITLAFFGGERVSDIYTGKINPITTPEIDNIVEDYANFTQNFSYQDAQSPLISFVLVNRKNENDFTNLDHWYERDQGETFGDLILYRVRLRQP